MPIEPPETTVLLDQLMLDTTIAYACVPGAGGDDAFVCFRQTSDANLRQDLKTNFLKSKPKMAVLPVSLLKNKALLI